MRTAIPDGVWPTMITPFTVDNTVDYAALEVLIQWYLDRGVAGLFAVCQSSEMFTLTLAERLDLARFVSRTVGSRAKVIASGHISSSLSDQIEELKAMADTGIEALVLVVNRLADQNDSEDTWKRNTEKILEALPNVPLGLYECPAPYKRLLSAELLRWCAETGQFWFLKDTSCHLQDISDKLRAVAGTELKIFNANAATLLESLKLGVSGYSGVMANFHPELYRQLMEILQTQPQQAVRLQNFLGSASLVERQLYPMNAKYHAVLEGMPIHLAARVQSAEDFSSAMRMEVQQLRGLAQDVAVQLKVTR